jgi:hypothetical protein
MTAQIESLILANHVESASGLLYVAGGGWTDYWRPAPAPGESPPVSHLGIGLTVLVPSAEAESPWSLVVRLEDAGGDELARATAALAPARRPDAEQAERPRRVVITLGMNLVFPGVGGYRVVADLGEPGEARRSVSFQVRDMEAG